jgi:cytochrome b561
MKALHWLVLLAVVIVGTSIANVIQLKRQGCL